MKLFDVYPINAIEPVKALGSKIWDRNGTEYLDLYGGHAVISIGHSHPHFVERVGKQLANLAFYSNSVEIPQQEELANHLGKLSGLEEFRLFLVNSGAEANENALKLASFHTGRTKIIAFKQAFHGRTSGAVAVTDNSAIKAPINFSKHVEFLPFNDIEALRSAVNDETCAVIVEGIQGVGGIQVATKEFLKAIRDACDQTGAVMIHDSVQCGYGRSGKFFSFQHYDVVPDIISMAKGMGNGFPIGGILIAPKFQAKHGMLGTTFGGNHLACAAGISVLETIEAENLVQNAAQVGEYLIQEMKQSFSSIKEVRGRGLMIGIEMEDPIAPIRKKLLEDDKIFTGVAGGHIIRLLPALSLQKSDANRFLETFSKYVS